MEHYVPPAKRSSKEEIIENLNLVANNPILEELMNTFSGILAVLDSNRQIVAVNNNILELIDANNTKVIMGFRLGEALNCVYADVGPDGCGTSKYCVTCGAGTAICNILLGRGDQNKICSLTVEDDIKKVQMDYALQVRTKEFVVDGHTFVLCLIQDVTKQEFWSSMEKVFFHDIGNVITGLVFSAEMLSRAISEEETPLVGTVKKLSRRLSREVVIQRYLSLSGKNDLIPNNEDISLYDMILDMEEIFNSFPGSDEVRIKIEKPESDIIFSSDYTLLLRILTNMLKNAIEASRIKNLVRAWFSTENNTLSILVWNDAYIPKEHQLRIFQRHYSTKQGRGRGLGTYSMKLFAEKILSGKINFTSTQEDGTTFKLSLPL